MAKHLLGPVHATEPVFSRVTLMALDSIDTTSQQWAGDVYCEFIYQTRRNGGGSGSGRCSSDNIVCGNRIAMDGMLSGSFSEWDLDSKVYSMSHLSQPELSRSNNQYGHLSYFFRVERHSAYIETGVHVPILILSMILPLIFFCPWHEHGDDDGVSDRLSAGSTLLLATFTFKAYISKVLPRTDSRTESDIYIAYNTYLLLAATAVAVTLSVWQPFAIFLFMLSMPILMSGMLIYILLCMPMVRWSWPRRAVIATLAAVFSSYWESIMKNGTHIFCLFRDYIVENLGHEVGAEPPGFISWLASLVPVGFIASLFPSCGPDICLTPLGQQSTRVSSLFRYGTFDMSHYHQQFHSQKNLCEVGGNDGDCLNQPYTYNASYYDFTKFYSWNWRSSVTFSFSAAEAVRQYDRVVHFRGMIDSLAFFCTIICIILIDFYFMGRKKLSKQQSLGFAIGEMYKDVSEDGHAPGQSGSSVSESSPETSALQVARKAIADIVSCCTKSPGSQRLVNRKNTVSAVGSKRHTLDPIPSPGFWHNREPAVALSSDNAAACPPPLAHPFRVLPAVEVMEDTAVATTNAGATAAAPASSTARRSSTRRGRSSSDRR